MSLAGYRALVLVLGTLAWAPGCTLCPSPYDADYGGYVTKTPRADMRQGRVGSIFSDPALDPPSTVEHDSEGESFFPGQAIDGMEILDGELLDD